MKIIITGTPGVGKTALAKNLSKHLNYEYINEKDFALKNKIGSFNEENELEIPIKELEKKANTFLKKKRNIILEGHVLCETKLKIDKIIIITIDPEELEFRLEQRNYPPLKLMDNVFCEGIEYCKKYVKKNYSKKQIIEIKSAQNQKITFLEALKGLNLSKKAQ